MPRNPRRRAQESNGSRRTAPFFFAPQSAFETAAMHADPEALLNLLDALCCRDSWVCAFQAENVLEDFAGKLVAALRAAQPRQQAGETLLGERGLCVIERRARHAEGERRLHDRLTLDAMPT